MTDSLQYEFEEFIQPFLDDETINYLNYDTKGFRNVYVDKFIKTHNAPRAKVIVCWNRVIYNKFKPINEVNPKNCNGVTEAFPASFVNLPEMTLETAEILMRTYLKSHDAEKGIIVCLNHWRDWIEDFIKTNKQTYKINSELIHTAMCKLICELYNDSSIVPILESLIYLHSQIVDTTVVDNTELKENVLELTGKVDLQSLAIEQINKDIDKLSEVSSINAVMIEAINTQLSSNNESTEAVIKHNNHPPEHTTSYIILLIFALLMSACGNTLTTLVVLIFSLYILVLIAHSEQ